MKLWCGSSVAAPDVSSTAPSVASVISTASVSVLSFLVPVPVLPLEAIALSLSRLHMRRSPAFAGDLLNSSQAVVRRLRQRRRLGGQIYQRPGHQEHHHEIKNRGESQGKSESLHL